MRDEGGRGMREMRDLYKYIPGQDRVETSNRHSCKIRVASDVLLAEMNE